MKDFVFREAWPIDVDAIMEIIDYARCRMLDEGKQQWDEHYPLRKDIEADIAARHGMVLCMAGRVEAYGAVIFGEEPAYRHIDKGRWLSEQPYAVVHRLAVSQRQRQKGLGMLMMQQVEEMAHQRGVYSIKIDTNFDNTAMLHLLKKMHFTYCGEVNYSRGTRKAYEKLLSD